MSLYKLADRLQEIRFSKNGLCSMELEGRRITLAGLIKPTEQGSNEELLLLMMPLIL